MQRLFWQILVGILAVFLAKSFIPGVSLEILPESNYFGIKFTENWQILILIGIVLGLINFFIKPILSLITLPLRILTLGLFSLILNVAILWFLDLIFPELEISGILPLFLMSLLVFVLNIFFQIK